MSFNHQQRIRCIMTAGIVITVAAVGLLFDSPSLNSVEKQQTVFAANHTYHALEKEETIIATSSFESSDSMINNLQQTAITTTACITSDFKEPEYQPVQTSQMVYSSNIYDSSDLNAYHGVTAGPSGKETYYNLPMGGVIRIMRRNGYSEQEYPYWIRDDGVKMFGDYIMVAADLNTRPKGTVLECSLGTAMVVDTGEFAQTNPTQLDVAVTW